MHQMSRSREHRIPRVELVSEGQLRPSERSAVSRVERRVKAMGSSPDISPSTAFRDLLKSRDLYALDANNIKPYNEEQLRLFGGEITPLPLRDRLPPSALVYLDEAEFRICRSEQEMDALYEAGLLQPIQPFWDPVLRFNRRLRVRLIQRLAQLGLVGYRLAIKGRVGLFCAGKKDGSLRLIVDGREPSSFHRRPPHSALGTPAAVASMDLSDQAFNDAGVDPASAEPQGAGVDLRHGFHQFTNIDMGSWFGMDFPEPAEVYDTDFVYCELSRARIAVPRDAVVFPVYEGLPMGWSWSLFFCQEATSYAQQEGVARACGLPLSGVGPEQPHALRDRFPSPAWSLSRAVTSTYVDNANFFGIETSAIASALASTLEVFAERNLVFHEVVCPVAVYSCVGIIFDGSRRVTHHRPERAWRLYLGLEYLLRRRGCTGFGLRIVNGHIVNHFMLARVALSAMDLVYRFVVRAGPNFRLFTRGELQELRIIQGLLFLCEVNNAAPWTNQVFCSDSSKLGFCLASAVWSDAELISAGRYLERWRFSVTEIMPPPGLGDPRPQRGWSAALQHVGLPNEEEDFESLAPRRMLDRRLPRSVATEVCGIPQLPDAVLAAGRWTNHFVGAWKFDEPIHMLEGRVTLRGLEIAAGDARCHGRRLLSIGDNMSSLLSYERGRARNFGLRMLTLRAGSIQLATEIQWRHRYAESARNPTDEGSRWADAGRIAAGHTVRGDRTTLALQLDSALAMGPSSFIGRPPREAHDVRLARVGAYARGRRARHPPGAVIVTPFLSRQDISAPAPSTAERAAPMSRRGRAALRDRTLAGYPGRSLAPLAALELYAGGARWTGAVAATGLSVACPCDREMGPQFDLADHRVRRRIEKWVTSGRLWYVHFGTPCKFWSIASSTGRASHLSEGMAAAKFTLRMVRLCERHQVHWSLENPKSSKLFAWPPLVAFLSRTTHHIATIDYCQYGCTYRKPTFVISSLRDIVHLSRVCQHDHCHELLQGKVWAQVGGSRTSKPVWKTSLASQYPVELCRLWASVLLSVAPREGHRLHGGHPVSSFWEHDLCCGIGHKLDFTKRFWPHCPESHVAAWLPGARQWGGAWTQPLFGASTVEQRRAARPGRSPGTQSLCCQAPRCSCERRSPGRLSSLKEAQCSHSAAVLQRQSHLPGVCIVPQHPKHIDRRSRHRARHAYRPVILRGRRLVHRATCALWNSLGPWSSDPGPRPLPESQRGAGGLAQDGSRGGEGPTSLGRGPSHCQANDTRGRRRRPSRRQSAYCQL
jgi:hypothetical protein